MGLLAFAGGRQFNRCDHIDQLSQTLLVESRTGVVLWQNPLQPWVVAFDSNHRIVDDLSDRRLLRTGLEMRPTTFLGDPENIRGIVLIRILRVRSPVITRQAPLQCSFGLAFNPTPYRAATSLFSTREL